MSLNRPSGISPLLKYAPAGTYVTVEQLPHGGSLQARMLSTQAVQLYWRYSLDGRTYREPIGVHDPSAPPKKMEPTPRGFSLAMALLVLRHLRIGVGGAVPDDDRHFKQADALRGPPPLGAEVNLVPPCSIDGVNDDGLQDAVQSDVIREFVDLGFRDLGTRVTGVLKEAGCRHHRCRSCGSAGRSRRRGCRLRHGGRIQQIQLQVARLAPWHAHGRHRADAFGTAVVPAVSEPPGPTSSLGVSHGPAKSQEQRARLTVGFKFLPQLGSHRPGTNRVGKPVRLAVG